FAVAGLIALSSLFVSGTTAELLTAYWVLPVVLGLQIVATTRHLRTAAHERELRSTQAELAWELVRAADRSDFALEIGEMGWWEYDCTTGATELSPQLTQLLEPTRASAITPSLAGLISKTSPADRSIAWQAFAEVLETGT